MNPIKGFTVKNKPTAESYTLYTEEGGWLGQVVITSDGFFAAVTDYGNFSYAWRAFGEDFKTFLIKLNPCYFASKMVTGASYVLNNKQVQKGADRFAELILPPLQAVLKAENDEFVRHFKEINNIPEK